MILDMSGEATLQTYDKKAEEKIERTDPYKGEFSPSSLSYSQCLRKFLFEKVYKLKSNHPQYPLIYGVAIHEGVEFFYKNLRSETLTFNEVKAGCIQAFVKRWASYKVRGDDKRNLDAGILILDKYCDTYRHEDVLFETVDVEGAQWVQMPNGTMLLCKLDRLTVCDNMMSVIDTKSTTAYLNDRFFRQFQQHISTSLYWHAMEYVYGKCDSIMIDAIRTPLLGPTSQSDQFMRRSFQRTDLQMEEALRTYCKKTDYMIEGMQKRGKERLDHFYCDQNRCDDYSGCPFAGVCMHGIDHPMIGTDFKFENKEFETIAREDFSDNKVLHVQKWYVPSKHVPKDDK